MIYYYTNAQINTIKYDNCIKNAFNSRVYAYSWYLNSVADNWDVLVLNNYEAVMPLPWKSKYFINYIYLPAWIQQLGVFSSNQISEELIQAFIAAIPTKFKKVTLQFNAENTFKNAKNHKRSNYILPLNKPYKQLYENYRKDRKKRLRQLATKNEALHVADQLDFQLLKQLFIQFYKNKVEINNNNFDKLEKLANNGLATNNAKLFGVYDEDLNLLSGLLTVKDSNRIVVLFSATSPLGFKKNAFSLLIDTVIKKYALSNYTLDFEGSTIKTIASFNKSFGAKEEVYTALQYYNLPF